LLKGENNGACGLSAEGEQGNTYTYRHTPLEYRSIGNRGGRWKMQNTTLVITLPQPLALVPHAWPRRVYASPPSKTLGLQDGRDDASREPL